MDRNPIENFMARFMAAALGTYNRDLIAIRCKLASFLPNATVQTALADSGQ